MTTPMEVAEAEVEDTAAVAEEVVGTTMAAVSNHLNM